MIESVTLACGAAVVLEAAVALWCVCSAVRKERARL